MSLCPCSLTPPSSCRASLAPSSHNHTGTAPQKLLWPFQELLTHHSQVLNSSSLKPRPLERVKKPLQQTFGISPEAGKGQPALPLHGTALWESSFHPSLPWRSPQPHLPRGIPSKQQHLPVGSSTQGFLGEEEELGF